VWISEEGERSQHEGLVSRDVVELEIPLPLIGLNGDSVVRFQVKVFEGGLERECYPERVPIEFNLTRREYALEHWMV
jgi:hypothetical protein